VDLIRHILALFWPGRPTPVYDADRNVPGNTDAWTYDQVTTLLEEGRRQVDRQNDELERVRSRAQVTLTLGLALGAAAGSLRATVGSVNTAGLWILWGLGLLLVGWAVLGAASTAVARADMSIIHATVLSNYTGNIRRRLAADYAKLVVSNERQIMTRVMNLWRAVSALTLGALLILGAWLWADATKAEPPQRPPCMCAPVRQPPAWPPEQLRKPPKHMHRPPCPLRASVATPSTSAKTLRGSARLDKR
jgi:hypothetical protein